MATFEIWLSGGQQGVHKPHHTVEADSFFVQNTGVILFIKDSNVNVHAVVNAPGIVIKKVK